MTAPSGRRPIVLHVDPHKDTRDLLVCMLADARIDLVGAENGEEAYQLALQVSPSLIISEIRLPVLDGFALARKVKQTPSLRHVPLIAWTGWTYAGLLADARAAGYERIVLKAQKASVVDEVLDALGV